MKAISKVGKSPAVKVIIGASVVGGTWVVTNDVKREEMLSRCMGAKRVFNMVVCVTEMCYNYWKVTNDAKVQNDKSVLLNKKLNELFEEEKRLLRLSVVNDEYDKTGVKQELLALKKSIILLSEERYACHDDATNQMSVTHTHCAELLKDLCIRNKGVYIKLGQHLSQLDYVLPVEYTTGLRCLLSDNSFSPWDDVVNVMQTEFGQHPDDLFSTIERIPVASASLAQVHIAYDKYDERKKYAVKVQHRHLMKDSISDMEAITTIVNLVYYFFPTFQYTWLTREMNKNMPIELDFRSEVQNMQKCAALLHKHIDDGSLAIPIPVAGLCSSRVITMSYEDGCHIDKVDCLKHDLGVDLADVARIISQVFCEQIYVHGFLHCDPHVANMLVRKHPVHKGKPQLVLLDHGLYRQLDDSFRRHYCRLWQAIILNKIPDIEKECKALNAGESYHLLASMVSMKPWDIITDTRKKVFQDEPSQNNPSVEAGEPSSKRLMHSHSKKNHALMKDYARVYYQDIVKLLHKMPSDMLLVMKTNDCLRHIDHLLKAPINSVSVVAEVTKKVIMEEELEELQQHANALDQIGYLSSWSRLARDSYMVSMRMNGLWMLSCLSSITKYIVGPSDEK